MFDFSYCRSLISKAANVLVKKRFWASLMCAIFTLWAMISACSSSSSTLKKTYTIARDDSWYPLNLMGKEKNMSAFVNDLLLAIAAEGKFRIELISVSNENLFNDLDDGDYDAVISVVQPTPYNRQLYRFSDPFYLIGPVLIVSGASPVHSLKELDGKIIGIRSGASTAYTAQKLPSSLIVPYDNFTLALDDLYSGKIDGVIMDAIPAFSLIHGIYRGKEKVVTAPLTDTGLRVIARHDPASEELIKRFNEGLQAMKKNGTYDKLVKKWDIINTNPDRGELMNVEQHPVVSQ